MSKTRVSFTQNFPISVSSGLKMSDQSSKMVKLNQKYDQLRRKRENLIRLLKANYRLTRLRTDIDDFFAEEDLFINLFDKAEAEYGEIGCTKATKKRVNYKKRLTDHKSYLLMLFGHKERSAYNSRRVSPWKNSLSILTTMTEAAPNGIVQTSSTPQDNEVNLVSSS